jgi:hypothetical protein
MEARAGCGFWAVARFGVADCFGVAAADFACAPAAAPSAKVNERDQKSFTKASAFFGINAERRMKTGVGSRVKQLTPGQSGYLGVTSVSMQVPPTHAFLVKRQEKASRGGRNGSAGNWSCDCDDGICGNVMATALRSGW